MTTPVTLPRSPERPRSCWKSTQVSITNCGSFFVYKLNTWPWGCVLGICTTNLPPTTSYRTADRYRAQLPGPPPPRRSLNLPHTRSLTYFTVNKPPSMSAPASSQRPRCRPRSGLDALHLARRRSLPDLRACDGRPTPHSTRSADDDEAGCAGTRVDGGRVANDLLLVEAHEMREYELRVCTQ